MRKLIFSVLSVAMLLISQSSSQAQMGRKPFDNGKFVHKNIVKLLELSPEQEKKFNDINYNHQKEIIELHTQIQKNRLEFKNLLANKDIDEKEIISLTEDNSRLRSEIKKITVERWLSVYKILNDNQREKWILHLEGFDVRERMKEGMKERLMERRGIGR